MKVLLISYPKLRLQLSLFADIFYTKCLCLYVNMCFLNSIEINLNTESLQRDLTISFSIRLYLQLLPMTTEPIGLHVFLENYSIKLLD